MTIKYKLELAIRIIDFYRTLKYYMRMFIMNICHGELTFAYLELRIIRCTNIDLVDMQLKI